MCPEEPSSFPVEFPEDFDSVFFMLTEMERRLSSVTAYVEDLEHRAKYYGEIPSDKTKFLEMTEHLKHLLRRAMEAKQ